MLVVHDTWVVVVVRHGSAYIQSTSATLRTYDGCGCIVISYNCTVIAAVASVATQSGIASSTTDDGLGLCAKWAVVGNKQVVSTC